MDQKEKYRGQYRISSARMQNYDYGQNGVYFITICTRRHECFFGEIINGEIKLSEMGEIIKIEWLKTSEIRKNIILGEWVIMPNHFHAVVAIKRHSSIPTAAETHCNASLQQQLHYKTDSARNRIICQQSFAGSKGQPLNKYIWLDFKRLPGNHDSMITSFVTRMI